MVDYMEAIKKPFLDLKKSGLAALFVWIPIVNFLSYGYFLECAKSSLENKKEMPEWANFWDKFLKGLLLFIIKIIYAIPLVFVAILLMGNVITEIMSKPLVYGVETGNINLFISKVGGLLLNSGVIGYFIVVIAVGIFISYLMPMAAVFYVRNWSFREIFSFQEIFRKVFTKEYFSAWVVFTIYSILLMSVGSLIPFVGGIIAPTLVGITGYSIFGSVYREIGD